MKIIWKINLVKKSPKIVSKILKKYYTNNLKKKDADEIIMKARENWFKEDKKKN